MDEPTLLLKCAVEEILQKINKEKLDPQSAVTKVASERELNPNFIKRASEVINVALTYNHFKKHANSKEEDFPIVDAQKVVSSIFGTKEKTASEQKSTWFTPSLQEFPNLNKLLTNVKFAEAYAHITNTKADDNDELSEKGVYEKSALFMDRLEKKASELAVKKAGLKYDYTRTFSTLVSGFSKEAAYRTSFGEFESQAFSKFGAEGVGYVDFIYKNAKIEEPRGSLDSKYTSYTPCKELDLLESFIKTSDEYAKVREELSIAEAQLKEAKEKTTAAYHAYGKSKYGGIPKFANDILTLPEGELKKQAAEVVEELPDPVLEKVRSKIQEQNEKEVVAEAVEVLDKSAIQKKSFDFVDSIVKKLSPSSHGEGVVETDADALDRRLILENLSQTDPILQSVEPKKLIDSYSQLLHLAPELAKEKEVVRAALRQMVSTQALGPFEAQQLVEANSKLLKQKMIHTGTISPGPIGKDN